MTQTIISDPSEVSELSKIVSDTWCTVVSIVPFEINSKKPGLSPGFFKIKASVGGVPALCHVPNCSHFVYMPLMPEKQSYLTVEDSAKKVANSIVLDYINAQLGVGQNAIPGIFYLPGKLILADILGKHQDKLEKARRMQKNWFDNIIKITQDDWTRYQKHSVISDSSRIIAQEMKLDPLKNAWMDQSKGVEHLCPACKGAINPGAVLCRHCRTNITEWNLAHNPDGSEIVEVTEEDKKKEVK